MQYYKKLLLFFRWFSFLAMHHLLIKISYIIVRARRIKWYVGQMCYISIASALYFVFVMIFLIILNIDCIEFIDEGGGGKVLNTLANTNIGTQFHIEFSPDRNVINIFSSL